MGSKLPPETVNKIIELYNEGWSVDDIAKRLGVHRSTVYRYIRKYRENKENEKENEKIEKEVENEDVNEEYEGGEGGTPMKTIASQVLQDMFGSKKSVKELIEIIEKAPDYYENNLVALHNLLAGKGFNEKEIRAFFTEYQHRLLKERFMNSFTFTNWAMYQYPHPIPTPFDFVGQIIMQAMAFTFAKPILRAIVSSEEDDKKGKSVVDQMREIIVAKYVADLLNPNRDNITMVKIPEIDEQGNVKFKDVPVKTSGAALFEMMLPFMLLAMTSKNEKEKDDVEKLIELAKILKPEGGENSKLFEIMEKTLNTINDLKIETIKSELKRLEDKIENAKKGDFDDFFSKIKKISNDLGLPLFGVNENVLKYRLEEKKLELDNLDKLIQMRMNLLEKIADIEQRLELGKSIKEIVEKGVSKFAEGVGEALGKTLFSEVSQPPAPQPIPQPPTPPQPATMSPQPIQTQPLVKKENDKKEENVDEKDKINKLKELTIKALGELNRLGEKEFLKMVHERLGKLVG